MQDFVESPILIKWYINMSVLFIDIRDAALGTKLVFWLVCPRTEVSFGSLPAFCSKLSLKLAIACTEYIGHLISVAILYLKKTSTNSLCKSVTAHLSYGRAQVAAPPPSLSGTCGTPPAHRWEESGWTVAPQSTLPKGKHEYKDKDKFRLIHRTVLHV